MRNFITIWKRELSATFLSPIAYVVMVAFIAASSWIFLVDVLEIKIQKSEPLSASLFIMMMAMMVILVMAVTMRLFASEKKSGTLESLMTAPVTETEVVLGKYAGAITFLFLVVLLSSLSLYMLVYACPGISASDLDTGSILGGYLIITLLTCFWTSIGMFISMLTRNQIVAAILTFTTIVLLLFLVCKAPFAVFTASEYLNAEVHVFDFIRGSVDTRPIVLYVTSTVFVVFASIKMLEARKW